MKLKVKQEKGITLIALIVTIIVLLILAAISIAMLTGQNGILGKAAETKKTTSAAQLDEQVKLAIMEARLNGLGKIESTEALDKYMVGYRDIKEEVCIRCRWKINNRR